MVKPKQPQDEEHRGDAEMVRAAMRPRRSVKSSLLRAMKPFISDRRHNRESHDQDVKSNEQITIGGQVPERHARDAPNTGDGRSRAAPASDGGADPGEDAPASGHRECNVYAPTPGHRHRHHVR